VFLVSKTFVWDKTNNDRPFLAVNQLTAPGSLLAAGVFGFDNALSRALLHAWMTATTPMWRRWTTFADDLFVTQGGWATVIGQRGTVRRFT
jgi:hypothetical protein